MAMKSVCGNMAGRLMTVTKGATRTFLEPDGLGSVRSQINSAGSEAKHFTYWPYGEVRTTTGVASATPFQFCGTWGYYTDPMGTNLPYYVRARYLRHDLGRWQTVDPLWPQEMPYGYVEGRVLARTDPSGRASKCSGDCCNDSVRLNGVFSSVYSHCGAKGWKKCPTYKEMYPMCAQFGKNQQECAVLDELIKVHAQKCSSMSGGGGYDDDAPWWMFADCCGDNNHPCGSYCCNNYNFQSSSLGACKSMCLVIHESSHLWDCAKGKPTDEGCAYSISMNCLLNIFKLKCKSTIRQSTQSAISACLAKSKHCAVGVLPWPFKYPVF